MAKINRHDKGASELFNLIDNLEPFYYQEKPGLLAANDPILSQ